MICLAIADALPWWLRRTQRALATTDWLERNLGLVVPVDASFHLPTSGRSAEDEYKRCHIKNARFFDIEKIRDTQSPYPHMLPSADEFAKYMAELGVSDEDHVVVYDSVGMFSSPRVWWMLKVFGHDKVSVLDGGLPKWVNEGRPVMDKEVKISPKFYKAHKPNTRLFVNYNAVVSHLSNLENTTQIIDARPPARFNGQALEPRIGLPSGHMPGSINVPGSDLLDPATNTLLPKEKLAELFKAKGVDLEKPIVTTCGSGVTACALLFALDRIGAKNVSVYDGSWSEFAARADQDGIKIFQRGPVRSSADQ
ncbi:rhodanese-related sulfurtransferase [Gonapodya prolifera JEL478]|uniref:Sulfurtransferase n=1 Tax=Gonapodya prolifera (strain JEL478) TaxID=1344416 RepID=A0A138ZZ35_GONPJ|nr:rhodanese-related sulfurtransferase [Gonapodya prolifera JEL478]|eukprot:KXS09769.1 rhodanese-related sulfurtransferase [Gonapodya prolifera JEL478]